MSNIDPTKSQKDEAKSNYEIGEDYYNGQNGREENRLTALHYYEKAAAYNNPDAIYSIGYMNLYSVDIPENEGKAVQYLYSAATMGQHIACFHLGKCFFFGWGLKQSDKDAQKFFQIAAEHGKTEAAIYMAHTYERADDYHNAVPWSRKAADAGHPLAMLMLSGNYMFGLGVKDDYDTSRSWYSKYSSHEKGSIYELKEFEDSLSESMLRSYDSYAKWEREQYRKAHDPIAVRGDFFTPDHHSVDGLCINYSNNGVCQYCTRRTGTPGDYGGGYHCRLNY